MSQVLSSVQYICYGKTLVSKLGAPNFFPARAPSNLGTTLNWSHAIEKHSVHCTQHIKEKTQPNCLNLAYSTANTSALLRFKFLDVAANVIAFVDLSMLMYY